MHAMPSIWVDFRFALLQCHQFCFTAVPSDAAAAVDASISEAVLKDVVDRQSKNEGH